MLVVFPRVFVANTKLIYVCYVAATWKNCFDSFRKTDIVG